MKIASDTDIDRQQLLQYTSQCVMCGLCSVTCPTYQVMLDENFSPRGRINIVQQLMQKQNPSVGISAANRYFLSTCLHCMTCQQQCPSEVNYAAIIQTARQYLYQHRSPRQRLLDNLSPAIWMARWSILRHFLRTSMVWLQATALKPQLQYFGRYGKLVANWQFTPPLKDTHLIATIKKNKVLIFAGCGQSLFAAQLAGQYQKLLQAIAIAAEIDQNLCCGALFARRGNTALAQRHWRQLERNSMHYETITVLNSHCARYCQGQKKAEHYTDSVQFLSHYYPRFRMLTFAPLPQTALLHISCSMRQSQSSDDLKQLLGLIPQLQLKTLPNIFCCGASGENMLQFPQLTAAISKPVVDYIQDNNIRIVISSDIGCALNIQNQLQEKRYAVDVFHPAALLYRQLQIRNKDGEQ